MGERRQVDFKLMDRHGADPHLLLTMHDGREVVMRPVGDVTPQEASVLCGGIMGAMGAGIRSDNFRHGEIVKIAVHSSEPSR